MKCFCLSIGLVAILMTSCEKQEQDNHEAVEACDFNLISSNYSPHQAIIAHRGAMHERPENTFSAFIQAINLGADIIEIDIRITKDGHLVIMHDETLDRTTNGTGRVADTTWEYIGSLDAGSWFSEQYKGERVPLFSEVLHWANKKNVTLMCDLKESSPQFEAKVIGEVNTYANQWKKKPAENLIIGIWSLDQSLQYSAVYPDARLIAIVSSFEELDGFQNTSVDFMFHADISKISTDALLSDFFQNRGTMRSIATTMGTMVDVCQLLDYSPDYIMTDNIRQLRESLETILSD